MAHAHRRSAPHRHGFTLVELLVVIGIITILITVLVPVISKARQAAYVTNSEALIKGLASACERYYQDFHAYPGPLGPDQVARESNAAAPATDIRGTELGASGAEEKITGSENLVLGLLGGLVIDTSSGQFYYDANTVGSGPMKLGPKPTAPPYNIINPKRYAPYVDKKGLSDGLFKYDSNIVAGDTNIPEFVDSFTDAMPFLYMRAKKGGLGVVGRMVPGTQGARQYRLNDVLAYTEPHAQPAGGNLSIGSPGANKQHGLRHLGVFPDGSTGTSPDTNDATDNLNATGALDAVAYLTSKAAPNAIGADNAWGTADDIITPASKDAYIIISAGKDRIYGTKDDLTNYGGAGQ